MTRPSAPSQPQPRLRGDIAVRFRGDKGYVLALTALMVIPIMAFTSLAVDLGAWYARAAQIQRASDAAALAGVWHLPDSFNEAVTHACNTIRRNGMSNPSGDCGGGNADIVVDITDISDALSYKLKVDIDDKRVSQYFSTLFKPAGVGVQRFSTGQYVTATKMGSARNFLGTGNRDMRTAAPTTARENFWLAISGRCASKEQGDRIMTKSDANYTANGPNGGGSWDRCTGGSTVTNPEYDTNGYFYGITFKGPASGPFAVQIFDAGHCTNGDSLAGDSSGPGSGVNQNFQTRYTLRGTDSPNNPAAATQLDTQLVGSNNQCGTWFTVGTISSVPAKGTYILQVQVPNDHAGTTSNGSNSFGIRVTNGTGSWFQGSSACTNDQTDANFPKPATCPQVHGLKAMGVYANAPSGNPVASFYLAETNYLNDGKVMQIDLWDPGEGSYAMEILDPLGNPVDFTWEVLCWNPAQTTCSDPGPNGGRTGTAGAKNVPGVGALSEALDLEGAGTRCNPTNPQPNNPQPGNRRGSCSKYSDRPLRIEVQLPSDHLAAYGAATWWRIRYSSANPCGGGNPSCPTDRTTWSISMKGSPVRLIP